MSTVEIKVPDIGDFKDVPIIEVFVKPGDAATVIDFRGSYEDYLAERRPELAAA